MLKNADLCFVLLFANREAFMTSPTTTSETDAPASSTGPQSYNLWFVWTICLVAAMGGLLFGYDWVVIGGAKPFYELFFEISNESYWQGWAMSSALVGCLLGAVLSGLLADRFGRKKLLILAGLLFTASAIGTALTWEFASFNAFRILGGIGIGLASSLSPMFIAEIAPAEIRGRFVSINQLTIVIGILAAQVVNFFIAQPVPTAEQLRVLASDRTELVAAYGEDTDLDAKVEAARDVSHPAGLARVEERYPELSVAGAESPGDDALVNAYLRPTWNGQSSWRWMFGVETLPAAMFFVLMFFIPESPRWLVKYDRSLEAHRVLERVGGSHYADVAIEDIRSTLQQEERSQVRYSDLLEPRLMKILALGCFLAIFQQWCGINIIYNYAQEVFQKAGYGVSGIMQNIVLTGIVTLAFTIVAMLTVDRLGRRKLMLFGSAGLALLYGALGFGYYTATEGIIMLLLVIAAVACYAVSLAPIVWVIVSEIFPNRIRGAALAVAVFALWAGSWSLAFTFPILQNGLDFLRWSGLGAHGTFWLYGVICLVGFFVVWRYLPETKGKSLEQIERDLVD
jgi:SP family sugar porter-like MFS transporter